MTQPNEPPTDLGVGPPEGHAQRDPQTAGVDTDAGTTPRSSPQTDPTCPYNQEAAGHWTAAERKSEDKVDEPGLTDADRQRRAPTY